MKVLLLALLCSIWLDAFSQKHTMQRLIVSEYAPDDGGYSYVTSYNFKDGAFLSKDTIFQGPRFKNRTGPPYAQFGGTEFLIKDKYIVTSNGSLIDLDREELVWENDHRNYNFVDVLGDSLVYESSEGEKLTYFFLDLADLSFDKAPTSAYNRSNKSRIFSTTRFYSNDHKEIYIRPSPAGVGKFDIFLAADKSLPSDLSVLSPRSVRHPRRDSDTALVTEVGFPRIQNLELSRVAIYWVDNNSFVYDKHIYLEPPGEKAYHHVKIRLYRIDSKSDSLLFEFNSSKISGFPGRFSQDALGQIHYKGNNMTTYLVDVHGTSGNTNPPFYLSKQFSFDRLLSESGANLGNRIYYEDSTIGEFWGSIPVAGRDIIALEYGEPNTNLSFPKGLKIWSEPQGEWTTIDLPWVNSILGWIE